MANTIVDTDYLFLSARIKAMECNLLSRERMERMLEAATAEDAAKVLQECGYAEMPHLGRAGAGQGTGRAAGKKPSMSCTARFRTATSSTCSR